MKQLSEIKVKKQSEVLTDEEISFGLWMPNISLIYFSFMRVSILFNFNIHPQGGY